MHPKEIIMYKLTERQIAQLTSHVSSNDRTAFKRRLDSMEQYVVTKVNPIEQQIIELRSQLVPMYDKIADLRKDAQSHCAHLPTMLNAVKDEGTGNITVTCNFCNSVFHLV